MLARRGAGLFNGALLPANYCCKQRLGAAHRCKSATRRLTLKTTSVFMRNSEATLEYSNRNGNFIRNLRTFQ